MSENSQNTTLFIFELPKGLKEEDISEHFSQFGMKKMTPHRKNDKTSIRIIFDTHQNAEKALQNTQEIKGQKVKLNWNQPNQHRPNEHQSNSLLVYDIPIRTKPEEREQYIKSILLGINMNQDRYRCSHKDQKFTLTFKNSHDASIAKQTLIERGQGLKAEFIHRPPNQNAEAMQLLPKEVVLIAPLNAQDDQQSNAQTEQELIPTPEHVYLSLKTDDGTLLFFESAENSEAFAQSQTQNQQVKVHQKVKPQVYNLAIQTLEKRTIYADGFKDTSKSQQEILKLFETKGKVIRLTTHSVRAVIVQYETEESCIRSYELHHYVDQNVQSPLTILPYFIKGSQKPEAGLIQINEFPPTKQTSELGQEFSKYGRILATSISPTGFDSYPYGFVLFESYEKAYEAKRSCQYGNVFLYPPLKPAEAIFAFTEGTNAPNNCLVIYDLPAQINEPEINTKCRNYGQVHSSYVLTDGVKKAAYIYFSQTSDAVTALVELNKEGYKCDLLNGNVLDQSSKQLGRIPLPRNWYGLLLFVQNFPSNDYGTKNLREDLMSLGQLSIDSCFVNLNPLTGVPNNHGIIFTRDIQTSNYLCRFSNFLKGMRISPFKANGGFTRNDPVQQQVYMNLEIRYRFPNINNPKITSREYIKLFIQINFDDIKDQLFKVVDNLSVNESYMRQRELLSFTFDWIESEVHKIKGQ